MEMTTAQLMQEIEGWQKTQKALRVDSVGWKRASDQLKPLFEEMARRQKANGGEPDWRKWK